jgi:uncharacterized protein (DUF3084 family)
MNDFDRRRFRQLEAQRDDLLEQLASIEAKHKELWNKATDATLKAQVLAQSAYQAQIKAEKQLSGARNDGLKEAASFVRECLEKDTYDQDSNDPIIEDRLDYLKWLPKAIVSRGRRGRNG